MARYQEEEQFKTEQELWEEHQVWCQATLYRCPYPTADGLPCIHTCFRRWSSLDHRAEDNDDDNLVSSRWA
eukprot:8278-Eustigmatos_ZCMA.PRE.1